MSTPEIASRDAPGVVSIFAGGGGLDLGLEAAGFRTLVAVELERWACATLRLNQEKSAILSSGRAYLQDARILQRDVRRVPGAWLMRLAGLEVGELAVLAGGPPCVAFSVAGPRQGLASETGRLFEAYARLLRTLRPKSFVFENVKGLLSAADETGATGGAWPVILRTLEAAGYRVSWRLIDAADYGVPQHRERLIVVGLRGKRGPKFEFPEPNHAAPELATDMLMPWRTVADALSGLPEAAEPGGEPTVLNHVARAHTQPVVESFAATPRGHRNNRFKRDRLRWDRPSVVIRAQGKPKRNSSGLNSSHQAIHPCEHRQLTVRECARIQTFPDWYEFPPTFVNGYRVVGDAVPPHLAEQIARSLFEQVFAPSLDDSEAIVAA